MEEIILKDINNTGIKFDEIKNGIIDSIKTKISSLKKVLLLPPDFTRYHSMAGLITSIYYSILKDHCEIDIMPALGTHVAINDYERDKMFGKEIPKNVFISHDWRNDVVRLGEVPGEFISRISGNLMENPISIELNKRLLDKSYDLIISIGQVVPHEVVGMANYTKNILVGCGGRDIINQSHLLGALYGIERIMGVDKTPVREVLDYAEEKFLNHLPLMYVLTVTIKEKHDIKLKGLFIGRRRKIFQEAVKLSQEYNINYVERPLKKVVAFLDQEEFKSTWLGNKAIYRTRMAIADGGELIILASGISRFGEDRQNDHLIRKYGYVGRLKILELLNDNIDLQLNQAAAAHLIHGSSDGRFKITYAVDKLTREEIHSVNYNYISYQEACRAYKPDILREGFNTLSCGEEIFYISNPALGLWAHASRIK